MLRTVLALALFSMVYADLDESFFVYNRRNGTSPTPPSPSPPPPPPSPTTRRRRSYKAPGAACTAANFVTQCTNTQTFTDMQCCAATSGQTGTNIQGNCVYKCTAAGSRDESSATGNLVASSNLRPYQLCQEVNNSTGDATPAPAPAPRVIGLSGRRCWP